MTLIDFVEKKKNSLTDKSKLVYMFLLANCMTYIYSDYQNFLCSYKLAPFLPDFYRILSPFLSYSYPAKKWLMLSCLNVILL